MACQDDRGSAAIDKVEESDAINEVCRVPARIRHPVPGVVPGAGRRRAGSGCAYCPCGRQLVPRRPALGHTLRQRALAGRWRPAHAYPRSEPAAHGTFSRLLTALTANVTTGGRPATRLHVSHHLQEELGPRSAQERPGTAGELRSPPQRGDRRVADRIHITPRTDAMSSANTSSSRAMVSSTSNLRAGQAPSSLPKGTDGRVSIRPLRKSAPTTESADPKAAIPVWAIRHTNASARCVCALHGSQVNVRRTPPCRPCVVVFTAWAKPRATSASREDRPVERIIARQDSQGSKMSRRNMRPTSVTEATAAVQFR